MHLSFSMFLSVSRHIPRHRVFVCVSFSTFFSFLAIIHVLQCVFLILHDFHSFSTYARSYTVCFSYSMISVSSPYSRSYIVYFSFSTFFSFLATFQDLHCAFFIFHVFHFSQHIPGPTVCSVHFLFFIFSVFLAIFHVIQCPHFPRFSFFSPHSRS